MIRQFNQDRIGRASQAAVVATTTVASACAAPTVAAAMGATSIPLLTWLGSFVGVTVAAATPVGWILAAAAAGGSVGLLSCKLINSGGRVEAREGDRWQRLRAPADHFERMAGAALLAEREGKRVEQELAAAAARGVISPEQAQRLRTELLNGTLTSAEVRPLLGHPG